MLVIFVSLLFQLVCAAEAPPVNYFPVCSVQVFHGRNAISYASVTLDEVIVGEEKLVPQDPMLPARYSYNPGLSHPVLSNDSFIQIGPDVALRYMQACEQVVFQGFQAARKCQVVSLRAANLDTLQFLEVEKGAVIEVPFWIAEALIASQIVSILPVRAFSTRTSYDLEAGPESLSLRELGPYFYRLGAKTSKLLPTDRAADLMQKTFLRRLPFLARPIVMPSESRHVGGLAQTADPHRAIFHTTGHTFASRLDCDEETVYRMAQEWRRKNDRWAERQSHKIQKLEIYSDRKLGHSFLS